ncbi:MAG: hypothetical protein J4F42_04820 [Desulfurellaceae bacterium]|nr:hypothetical protein [Desulfurellaceae bacterium]
MAADIHPSVVRSRVPFCDIGPGLVECFIQCLVGLVSDDQYRKNSAGHGTVSNEIFDSIQILQAFVFVPMPFHLNDTYRFLTFVEQRDVYTLLLAFVGGIGPDFVKRHFQPEALVSALALLIQSPRNASDQEALVTGIIQPVVAM